MMRACWHFVPDDRPTFKEIRSNTSKYIEQIAGYLEIAYNPFVREEDTKEEPEHDTGFVAAFKSAPDPQPDLPVEQD